MTKLFILSKNAKRGEISYERIEKHILNTKTLGKGRPSKQEGWWKLDSGDWAKILGTHFIKIEGDWFEIKELNLVSPDLLGLGPLKADREKRLKEKGFFI